MAAALKHLELFADKVNWAILRENKRLLVYKAHYSKMTKASVQGVVTSSKGLLQEESDLPRVCTSDGFDLNAYMLMEKFGFDFSKPPSLRHVIEAELMGSMTRKK